MNLVSKTEEEQRKVVLGLVAAAMADLRYSERDIEDVTTEIEYRLKTTDDIAALQLYDQFLKK